MQTTGFRKLQAEEFDAARLEQLTKEGKVYIAGKTGNSGISGKAGISGLSGKPGNSGKPGKPGISRNSGLSGISGEVLRYVGAIDAYASAPWREGIGALWLKLAEARCMAGYLAMRRGPQAGRMNRYAVTALVYRLLLGGRLPAGRADAPAPPAAGADADEKQVLHVDGQVPAQPRAGGFRAAVAEKVEERVFLLRRIALPLHRRN